MLDDAVAAASAGGGFASVTFALWKLLNWLTRWSERRQERLDAQEERADREWQKIREDLREEIASMKREAHEIKRQNMALHRAFNHVASALIARDPHDPALQQANRLLAAAFPLDFALPASLAEAALDQLHHD